MTKISIKEVIKDSISAYQVVGAQNGVRITFTQENNFNKTIEVITDAERVSQVIQNILRKALSLAHTDTNVAINCWTSPRGKEIRLYFSVTS